MSSKPTFTFYLNTYKKDKNGKLPIYMRLAHNRKKKELDSGYYCSEEEWNTKKQRTKSNYTTNDQLADLEGRFYDKINEFKKSESQIDLEKLKNYVTNTVVDTIPILNDYIQLYCTNVGLRTDVTHYTKDKYGQIQQTMEAYLKKIKRSNLLINEIDFRLIDGYDSFLRKSNFFGKQLAPNTLAKYHTRLKTICLKALNEGLLKANPYTNFKIKTVPTTRSYLTLQEIKNIEKLDLDNVGLEKSRDVFLFSVYTSLRFSDASALKRDNLYLDSKKKIHVKWIVKKSKQQISLPLFDIPIKIIEKYATSDECKIFNTILPGVTNHQANIDLKIIGKMAKIKMNLTYHVARHTFATTMWLDNGGSIEVLQKILGHSNIRETMIYAKITSNLLEKAFEEVNNKLNHG